MNMQRSSPMDCPFRTECCRVLVACSSRPRRTSGFCRDRDGDGRADEKAIVLTGFGEGNTQLRVNGLFWGLDNLIYAANGRSDGEVRAPEEPPSKAVSIRRRDLRFRLKQRPGSAPSDCDRGDRRLQPVWTGTRRLGKPLPFVEHDPDPPRRARATALDRNPYLAETSSVASILDLADGGRIFGISPAQARFNRESVAFLQRQLRPLTIERGDWLPATYHGNVFVCEPLTNLVHRRTLEPDGVTFTARRAETGKGIPRLIGPGVPSGQPGYRTGRSPDDRRHVP